MKAAAQTIRAIFRAGFLPCALEIADAFTLAAARKRTGSKLLEGCQAHLIVELDGQETSVRRELQLLEKVVRPMQPRFIRRAQGAAQCETIWQLRRGISSPLRGPGLTKMNS